jgi:hypothetical protein
MNDNKKQKWVTFTFLENKLFILQNFSKRQQPTYSLQN